MWRFILVLGTMVFILYQRVMSAEIKFRRMNKKSVFEIFYLFDINRKSFYQGFYESLGDLLTQFFALFAYGYEFLSDWSVRFLNIFKRTPTFFKQYTLFYFSQIIFFQLLNQWSDFKFFLLFF